MAVFSEDIQKVLYIISLAFAGVLIAGFLFLRLTGLTLETFIPFCFFLRLTGFYCPGCGGTRAARFLLHGHLLQSIIWHPVVPYTALILFLFMGSYSLYFLGFRKCPLFRLRPVYFYISIILILGNWFIKNLLIWQGLWNI